MFYNNSLANFDNTPDANSAVQGVDILDAYKNLLGKLSNSRKNADNKPIKRSKTERKTLNSLLKDIKKGRDPYSQQYGSEARNVASRDILDRERKQLAQNDPYVARYGNQAEDMRRQYQLNKRLDIVNDLLAVSQEQRQNAIEKTKSLGVKDPTSKDYVRYVAGHGNSAEAFGMADVKHWENVGENIDDIRRMALTTGKVGPKARAYLGI